jgi:hypothetical protein
MVVRVGEALGVRAGGVRPLEAVQVVVGVGRDVSGQVSDLLDQGGIGTCLLVVVSREEIYPFFFVPAVRPPSGSVPPARIELAHAV